MNCQHPGAREARRNGKRTIGASITRRLPFIYDNTLNCQAILGISQSNVGTAISGKIEEPGLMATRFEEPGDGDNCADEGD